MFSRRTIVAAGVATGAFAKYGIEVAEAEPVKIDHVGALMAHPLMQNVIRENAVTGRIMDSGHGRSNLEAAGKLSLAINGALIAKYGDKLFPDPSMYMTASVQKFNGQEIEAVTRKLSARYVFSVVRESGYTDAQSEAMESETVGHMADMIYSEISDELRKKPGIRYYPYVPVTSSGVVIDTATFDPIVSFMTRYAAVMPA